MSEQPGESHPPLETDDALAEELARGSRRALSRAITLVESDRDDHRRRARQLLALVLPTGRAALRIGVSGAPGAGKSTLIEALGLVACERGRRPAVLAIDPSSAIGGGSILGDKTRMGELARRPEAFIRPSPAGRAKGGVARRTRETILLAEAAGHDPVLVETVGAGQSEHEVAGMVDVLLVAVAPGGGDDLQAMKRGILELADIVAVTKADGELRQAAERARDDHLAGSELALGRRPGFPPEVLLCSAVTGEGIPELWSALERRAAALREAGTLDRQRREQRAEAMWAEVKEGLAAASARAARDGVSVAALEEDVRAGRLLPEEAADALLESVLRPEEGD